VKLRNAIPVVAVVATCAIVAPLRDPERLDPALSFCSPQAAHPLGCGEAGVDLLALVAHAVLRGAVLALVVALAVGSPGATPAVHAAATHRVQVGTRADFVAQTNFVQCVGASMQMMLNMIEPGRDRTAATQLRLQRLARSWSGPRPDGRERAGASVRGWASGLNLLGGGPYRLVGESTLQGALRVAARAIAETGKPVGLLVWRGRHAWVMRGFTATADPLTTPDFEVTGVDVFDPLYPRGSAAWGPSPAAGATIGVAEVGRQFVPRRMSVQWVGPWSTLGGKYVLVLPYVPDVSGFAAAIR
jgi:hypothetical protein